MAEYNASGAMLKRYVHGPAAGADDPLIEYTGSGTAAADRRNLYADARGSIVLSTDSAGGAAQINSYDEYGVPGQSNTGRFQYTGQIWLPELGMNYYKARMYSPLLGRFMQTDPIGYEDNVNLYGYVGNDPINGVDPTGKQLIAVDEQADKILTAAKDDPNTTLNETNELSIEKGVPVYVQTGGTSPSGTRVDGALTSPENTVLGSDGQPQPAIIVTIDTRDKPV